MLLTLTASGKYALQYLEDELSAIQMWVLNLADGTRTREELIALTGKPLPQATKIVDHLVEQGLLADLAAQRASRKAALASEYRPDGSAQWADTRGISELARSTGREVAAAAARARSGAPAAAPVPDAARAPAAHAHRPAPPPPSPMRHAPAHAPAPTPAGSTAAVSKARGRRSIVSTKMYMLDMLRLVRHPQSAHYQEAVQQAGTEQDLMAHVFNGLHFIAGHATPSYVAKIMTRLQEVVPVEYVDELDRMIFQALMDEQEAATRASKPAPLAPTPAAAPARSTPPSSDPTAHWKIV